MALGYQTNVHRDRGRTLISANRSAFLSVWCDQIPGRFKISVDRRCSVVQGGKTRSVRRDTLPPPACKHSVDLCKMKVDWFVAELLPRHQYGVLRVSEASVAPRAFFGPFWPYYRTRLSVDAPCALKLSGVSLI